MKLHRGRLIDHLQLTVRDLEASRRFYSAVLEVFDIPLIPQESRAFAADELWITDLGEPTGRTHFAIQAADHEQVRAFHTAGLAAGGVDNGPPGPRDYHPGYFAAYLLDPDGNNIEAVFHGPATRSAPSVELNFDD